MKISHEQAIGDPILEVDRGPDLGEDLEVGVEEAAGADPVVLPKVAQDPNLDLEAKIVPVPDLKAGNLDQRASLRPNPIEALDLVADPRQSQRSHIVDPGLHLPKKMEKEKQSQSQDQEASLTPIHHNLHHHQRLVLSLLQSKGLHQYLTLDLGHDRDLVQEIKSPELLCTLTEHFLTCQAIIL